MVAGQEATDGAAVAAAAAGAGSNGAGSSAAQRGVGGHGHRTCGPERIAACRRWRWATLEGAAATHCLPLQVHHPPGAAVAMQALRQHCYQTRCSNPAAQAPSCPPSPLGGTACPPAQQHWESDPHCCHLLPHLPLLRSSGPKLQHLLLR
eukprot:1161934-Pelagomonas_calceolata.AAC.4